MRFAVEPLNAALAEEGLLEAPRRDAAALESAFVVEQFSRGRARHANARAQQHQAYLKKVGVELAASLRDVTVRVAQERQRGVEYFIAGNCGHGMLSLSGCELSGQCSGMVARGQGRMRGRTGLSVLHGIAIARTNGMQLARQPAK
jgi:hypothetical protein